MDKMAIIMVSIMDSWCDLLWRFHHAYNRIAIYLSIYLSTLKTAIARYRAVIIPS